MRPYFRNNGMARKAVNTGIILKRADKSMNDLGYVSSGLQCPFSSVARFRDFVKFY